MRRCLRCGGNAISASWRCSDCGAAPVLWDGIQCFAPELAAEEDGFDPATFEALSGLQERSFWYRSRNRLFAWALLADFPRARNLLEIGCGTGFVLKGFNEAAPRLSLTGSEVQTAGLAFARNRVDVTLQQFDARDIPYEEEFDVIGAFDVIEHIDEDEEVLAQMREAVRPGGGVMVTVPQHPWLWSEFDAMVHHKRRYTRRELVDKVQRAGFTVRRVTSFMTTLLPALAVRRLRPRRNTPEIGRELTIPALNGMFDRLVSLELALIRRGVSLPAGGSLFVTAVRM